LVEAVATGRSSDAVFTELHKEEAAKKACVVQLARLDQLTSLLPWTARASSVPWPSGWPT
jgi:hypothetical protein